MLDVSEEAGLTLLNHDIVATPSGCGCLADAWQRSVQLDRGEDEALLTLALGLAVSMSCEWR